MKIGQMSIPHTRPADWSGLHPAEGRLARAIRSDDPKGCRVAILGLPDDTGIGLNGGRRGAREGPAAFRRALAGYGSATDAASGRDLGAVGVFDAGDVEPAGDEIAHTHDRVTDAVGAILDLGLLPVCVGGGHDLTYPAVRAVYQRVKRLGGVNIDAHLDVRERIGSGMAFRRIIEDGAGVVDAGAFASVGLGPFANAREHVEWLKSKGAMLVMFDGEEKRLVEEFKGVAGRVEAKAGGAMFASFDLDVIDGSAAPGVSAVNPMGISAVTASAICRSIGRIRTLRYFDLVELSPPHDDEAGRTARLAAHLFLSFLAGVAERVMG